jgi:signal transduction histidine kinase
VQESVTNVMKHAADHHATVVVDVGAEVVDITVTDVPLPVSTVGGAPRAQDRRGPHLGHRHPSGIASAVSPETRTERVDGNASSQGNGLVGMHERAAAVGGSLVVGPTPDGGWSVRARLPIGEPAATATGDEETNA